MSNRFSIHGEVFVPADAPIKPGTRIVHPPRPDSDGMYDFCDVEDWAALMTQVHVTCVKVCALLRDVISTTEGESARRLTECLTGIETIRPLFLCRHLHLIPDQQRWKDICAVAFCEAMVWAGEECCLRMMSAFFTGSTEKWGALSRALVENNLACSADWRQAKSPAKWVKTVTNRIAREDERARRYAVDPVDEHEMIPLEEIAESPIETLLERKYSPHSLSELEAAAKEDPETAAYLTCKLRHPSWSCQAIWRHLNWSEAQGKRIDRRYRRLRQRLLESGMGIQCRDYRPPAGISDANFTAYREELFEGTRGQGVGVWQHRRPGD